MQKGGLGNICTADVIRQIQPHLITMEFLTLLVHMASDFLNYMSLYYVS